MNILFNPRWRLVWSAGMVVGAAAFVGIDALVRQGGYAGLAPSAAVLWLSVALGAALGAAAALCEGYLLRNRREDLAAVTRAPWRERLRWHHQKANLGVNGLLLLALLALIGWCYFSGIFVLPALFAMNGVAFAANGKRAGQLHEELQQRTGA